MREAPHNQSHIVLQQDTLPVPHWGIPRPLGRSRDVTRLCAHQETAHHNAGLPVIRCCIASAATLISHTPCQKMLGDMLHIVVTITSDKKKEHQQDWGSPTPEFTPKKRCTRPTGEGERDPPCAHAFLVRRSASQEALHAGLPLCGARPYPASWIYL